MSLRSFTKFPELPPEIQLQIWESTIATQPAMHLFDVCVPPCGSDSTAMMIASPTSELHSDDEDTDPSRSKEDAICLDEATDTLYLTALDTTTKDDISSPTATSNTHTQGARFHSDPSMYKFRADIQATCFDAEATMRASTARSTDTNTIRLGGASSTGASITYDNTQDVLHLRFTPPAFRFPGDSEGRLAGPISAIFESIWSDELAGALHGARRVAIDVSQLWPDLGARDAGGAGAGQQAEDGEGDVEGVEGWEEEGEGGGGDVDSSVLQDIAFLACTMQNDLEVLYLVDYCAGRCDSSSSSDSFLKARDLMDRTDEGLYRALRNGETWQKEKTREQDVIHGVGKVWREVFDLEKLGWDEKHPGFVFAEMFGEVVRMQQGNWMGNDNQDGEVAKEKKRFQGVRVLVVENDEDNRENDPILLRCDNHRNDTKSVGHSP
ncbi:hypothetical protein Daus18300_012982 [Diaporthe australafricana]|uniref:2EXR domain-containing protein n=1 Tax=Diaporthe australafricana TaxID=127596 RepID=A0ABR3W0S9_9PEZI